MTFLRSRCCWPAWVVILATLLNVVVGSVAYASCLPAASQCSTKDARSAPMSCHEQAKKRCCCSKPSVSKSATRAATQATQSLPGCGCSVGAPENQPPAKTSGVYVLGKAPFALLPLQTATQSVTPPAVVEQFWSDASPPGRSVQTPGPSRAPPAPC